MLALQKRYIALVIIPVLVIFFWSFSTVIAEVIVRTSVVIYNPFGVTAKIIAIPERRVANVGVQILNRSVTNGLLTVYPANADRSDPSLIVFTTSTITTGDAGETVGNLTLTGLQDGVYDIIFKDDSHLARLISNVIMSSGVRLDFTEAGLFPLYAGDINLTMGDNKVNALDMSVLVNNWGSSERRSDLNQDTEVNALDAGTVLDNFNLVGD
jgi:hypothetical protein